MRCGYLYEMKLWDFTKSNKFYKKADKLRHQNNINHNCLFTFCDLIEIANDPAKSLSQWEQLIKENKRVCRIEYTPSDLCVKCIHAHAKLDDNFERSLYFQNRYKY
ncbi:hypothetical protein RF11_14216 [Thelohanellus kitauei]|uniref:Uncharacterized protein n=1 Tax=Thelohanellus kitauei TaxID=669202 RepID=A0A0C2MPP4_THEKT|nr:hypothetical protein RF11_14216 [Thelohanellus kitauei]